jgi:hypothetical protein
MKSKFALACGMKHSYLTMVLKEQAHLTPEQAYRAALFWSFSPRDTHYWMTLVGHNRAGTGELKSHYQKELARIRSDDADLHKRYQVGNLESQEATNRYYSHWLYSAVHMLTTIRSYQRASAIATRLNISTALVQQVLCSKEHLHLSRTSPINAFNHALWRTKAVESALKLTQGNVHYTSTFSLGRQEIETLRQRILQWIDESRGTISTSGADELFCLNLDFFLV